MVGISTNVREILQTAKITRFPSVFSRLDAKVRILVGDFFYFCVELKEKKRKSEAILAVSINVIL